MLNWLLGTSVRVVVACDTRQNTRERDQWSMYRDMRLWQIPATGQTFFLSLSKTKALVCTVVVVRHAFARRFLGPQGIRVHVHLQPANDRADNTILFNLNQNYGFRALRPS